MIMSLTTQQIMCNNYVTCERIKTLNILKKVTAKYIHI